MTTQENETQANETTARSPKEESLRAYLKGLDTCSDTFCIWAKLDLSDWSIERRGQSSLEDREDWYYLGSMDALSNDQSRYDEFRAMLGVWPNSEQDARIEWHEEKAGKIVRRETRANLEALFEAFENWSEDLDSKGFRKPHSMFEDLDESLDSWLEAVTEQAVDSILDDFRDRCVEEIA